MASASDPAAGFCSAKRQPQADEWCDPPGVSDNYSSEKLLRLKRGFLCYRPPENAPLLSHSESRKGRPFTFGSFNNPAKISRTCLEVWSRILKAVPQSRFYVKYGSAFNSEWLRERWREVFASNDVDPSRLHFAPEAATIDDHLAAMASVNLALDSFPYQGTLTTLECLTVGTPVVSLAGEYYARRATSAIFLRLGFSDLVAATVDEYIAKAIQPVCDPTALENTRSRLRNKFVSSEICDVLGYVNEFEDSVRQLWHAWCVQYPKN